VYFNRDKTQGLTDRSLIGELDWSVSSVHVWKVYEAYFEFFKDPLSTSKALPFARGYTEEEVRLPRPELSKKIRAYWEKVLSELQIFVQKELKNNFSFQKNRLF
jgi:hypothetical protein